jgi:putative membrane protein insertion efficiency factor
MRILAWPLIVLVRAYQWVISPILPAACRFEPSCSVYALGALRRFGPLAGTFLAARRMARCHPWGDCGEDPVPDTLDGLWPWRLFKHS